MIAITIYQKIFYTTNRITGATDINKTKET